MSDEENSGVFSRRKDYERRVPVATIPLPTFLPELLHLLMSMLIQKQ